MDCIAPYDEYGVRHLGAGDCPSSGRGRGRLVVKENIALAGASLRFGNPWWNREAEACPRSHPIVRRLAQAGFQAIGQALCDELTFSLSGENPHFGTPRNPLLPGHVPGGSSSACASAVAAGIADISLGTDTAGSVRLPASYCGVLGIRLTGTGIVDPGVVPLAPSFDALGLMATTTSLLIGALSACGFAAIEPVDEIVLLEDAFERLAPADRPGVEGMVALLESRTGARCSTASLASLVGSGHVSLFQGIQSREAWIHHERWLTANIDHVSAPVRERMDRGRRIPAGAYLSARQELSAVRARHAKRRGTVYLLPTSTRPPPPRGSAVAERDREALLELLCVASLLGLPCLSVPAVRRSAAWAPSLSIIGWPHSEQTLLDMASVLTHEAQS